MWPWSRREPKALISVSDPVLAEYFNPGGRNYSGVPVNEQTALGLSAVWRAVSLISQTIASLPLRALQDQSDGTRRRVGSFLNSPGGLPGGPTQFEWTETVLVYLLLHGAAPLAHVFNGAGSVIGATPVHPLAVTPEWETDDQGRRTGRKVFHVSLDDGTRRTFTQSEMTYIPALSLDGLYGVSPIWVARNSLGTAVAGDRAAATMFGKGAHLAGLVSAEEDISEAEATAIKSHLDSKITGVEHAGEIAMINRKLKFTPWTMTNEDAQFLESRMFSISEVARWYGIPEFLLQAEKATSWGTGIAEQQRGLARMVLAPWANRIEQRLSRLLPPGVKAEFDFAGLERGAPESEINLLIQQVQAGLLTKNEARRIRNLPPLPGGDQPPGETQDNPQEEQVPA